MGMTVCVAWEGHHGHWGSTCEQRRRTTINSPIGLDKGGHAVPPEEGDKVEEMTTDEMVVDGYYVLIGIVSHKYKQGWKFLTMWERYWIS